MVIYQDEAPRRTLETTINGLRNMVPGLKDVKVDLSVLEYGDYKAKIEVRLKGKKFVATKSEKSLAKTLLRAQKAVLKQLEKFNNKSRKYFVRSSEALI